MEDKYFIPGQWINVVITSQGEVENEAAKITELLQTGAADAVHIRKPDWSMEQIADLIAEIPVELHPRLVLHDHYKLHNYFGKILGIQLNRRNKVCREPWFSTKTLHSIDELEKLTNIIDNDEVDDIYQTLDYITLSPIYDSISKQGYKSTYNLHELRDPLRKSPLRVIALGGVRPSNFRELCQTGFSGAAMLGYVWDDFYTAIPQLIKQRALVRNFPFQFITNGEGVVASIRQAYYALRGGCRWIQLRMKETDENELRMAAQSVHLYCEQFGATMIIDDNVHIAKELGIGVHLGKDDMPASEAREILGPDAIIGCTCNTAEDMARVNSEGVADYIGLGPFRHTTTKKKLAPVIGIDGYTRLLKDKDLHKLPTVVIGGIKREDLPELAWTGADGVAVSGALTRNIEKDENYVMYEPFVQATKSFGREITDNFTILK